MSEHGAGPTEFSPRGTLIAIALIVVAYVFALWQGWPQEGTRLKVESHHAHEEHDDHEDAGHNGKHDVEHGVPHTGDETRAGDTQATGGKKPSKPTPPALFTVAPFVILLLCIAVLPLIHSTEHWWESNLHRFYVAAGLGLLTLVYFLFHPDPVELHFLVHKTVAPQEGLNWNIAWTVIQNAMFQEYAPFIVLLFALYAISGGIRIEGDLPARPLTNTAFIGIGALLASFVGTTGAAMLLIRPLLETNRERKYRTHTVVFFIFAVCNCGGCLLPIGDPPLFLGYLEGVEFMWTMTALWKEWLFVNVCLLVVYFVWDRIRYSHESVPDIQLDETQVRPLRIYGLINFVWLGGVILAVALLDPGKQVPGTHWHPWLFLREVVQVALVGASLLTTERIIRNRNHFNYGAILEVAALFIGIFICMQPALQILDAKGAELGIKGPMGFFWITGSLSAVLDNAPTYLVFFKTAAALDKPPGAVVMADVEQSLLVAISLGAVFMGAMTYIGNGPNFMVKAIAETQGVKMPSFFGYIVYSVLVLLPILVVCTLIFL